MATKVFDAVRMREAYMGQPVVYAIAAMVCHSAHIPPGRDGLFNLIRSSPNDMLAEHWDVLQDEATEAESKSGLPMFGTKFPS
jgi:hypothetical protein